MTLSGTYGREQMYSATHNLPNQIALNAALSARTPEAAFNPFGGNSRALIDSLRMSQIDRSDSSIRAATVVADGTLTQLASGDARLALGSELRREAFGNGINSPFDRQVRSAFAELSLPIIGDVDDPRATPRLELSLAGRYERYSDFGSTWNPKLGARWAPSEWFKVRASWGTSFKAPRLTDLHDASHDSVSLVPLKDPRSATGSSVVLALQGRNPDLTQETAKTWTAGIDFAFRRWPGAALSLTYYSIDYTNRIALPAALAPTDILLQEDQWASAIDRNVSRAQIETACASPYLRGATVAQCLASPVAAIVDFTWRNLAGTKVKGIDLKFDREVQTSSFGAFKLDLSSSYMLSFDQAVSDTSPIVNLVDTVGNPLALRFRGTLEWYEHGWDLPGFGASMTLDHTGAYRDVGLVATRDVAGATTLDVQVSYRTPKADRFLGDLDFILNTANVFDKAPPFVNREDGYDTRNTDPYGRVVSFSISKKW
jgi:outer membrane receptor protein involved in Fe transport